MNSDSREPEYRERLCALLEALVHATPDEQLPLLDCRSISEWLAQLPVGDSRADGKRSDAVFKAPAQNPIPPFSKPAAVPALNCAGCGSVLPSSAKFCPECGRTVAEARRCINCNAPLQQDANFCASCGFRVG